MTSEDLLRITSPEHLFNGNAAQNKDLYRRLASEWHPDRGHPEEIFLHIKDLYNRSAPRADAKLSSSSKLTRLDTPKGVFVIRYYREHDFELGKMYVGDTHVTYVVDEKHDDLVANFLFSTGNLKYADKTMEKEFSRFFPGNVLAFSSSDGRHVIKVPKKREDLLLRDVMAYYGEDLDPRHSAWILSSLYNLACYFEFSQISHQAIGPDTYFINPEDHSGKLLGGWWHTTLIGNQIKHLPRRTFQVLPWDVRRTKKASSLTDRELILATGRELTASVSLPEPFSRWIRGVAGKSAFEAYRDWREVLVRSFGERRFTPMHLTAGQVYSK